MRLAGVERAKACGSQQSQRARSTHARRPHACTPPPTDDELVVVSTAGAAGWGAVRGDGTVEARREETAVGGAPKVHHSQHLQHGFTVFLKVFLSVGFS